MIHSQSQTCPDTERELVLSAGGSQQGDRTSLLMDYDQEQLGKSEGGGWGEVEMS